MKVSRSLPPPPPHKNCHHTPGAVERVLADLVFFSIWWLFGGFLDGFVWVCSAPFGIVWLGSI